MSNFARALIELLVLEGGLVDNPADPGGRTNLGVTQKLLDQVRHKYADLPAVVDDLTPDNVAPIYKGEFWDAIRGDELPAAIASCVFKQAVNQGAGRAIIELQSSLGLALDGNLGPVTLAAAQRKDPKHAVADFISAAILNYTRSSNFETFGHGWINRAVQTAVEAFA